MSTISDPDATLDAWAPVRHEVRRSVSDAVWHLWLEPLRPVRVDDGVLVLSAPARSLSWVGDRYGRLLRTCAQAVLGPGANIEIVEAGPGAAAIPPTGGDARPAQAGVPLSADMCFEQFVIGPSNRLAHAAALAVAEAPGSAYNPLFLFGPSGMGKTHLLQSIGHYVRASRDGTRVRYTTVEAFTNHFLGALHGRTMDAFKAAYRDVGVLLVDDVQFLERKTRTEQEFLHTFNALLATGAQVVLSCDRRPGDMESLEERLRERFAAGLVTDLSAPDRGTRLAILRHRLRRDGLEDVDPEALESIVTRVRADVRTLEGALIRVVAYGSLTGRPIDAALAEEVLASLYPGEPQTAAPVTMAEIQRRTSAAFGLTVDALVGPSRTARVAWARQVAMFLARELTPESLPAIGRAFGGRGHTTVLAACRRTTQRITADVQTAAIVARLQEELVHADADRPA